MNYARLNHILIPNTKDERDRWRDSKWSRLLSPLSRTYFGLSEEGRMLFAFTAFVGLAGLDVGRSQSHLVWALLLSLIFGSTAMRRFFDLPRVKLRVTGPDRVTVGEPAHFQVTLENRGDRDHHSLRLSRPFLPWDGKWSGRPPALPTLPAGERRTLGATARFAARGVHHIDSFSAAALVPLGLAVGPFIRSSGTRFTVVPKLARIRRISLPITPQYQPGGVALASHTGESMELMGVRPYRAGDRIRDLHAVTWARCGEPAVREYQQEYFSRVGVVLDTDLAKNAEEQLEAMVSLAAGVTAHLSLTETLIDLLVCGDRLHPLTVGRSLGHLDQALDHLSCVTAGPGFDHHVVLSMLRPHLSRLSCIVFIASDWSVERRALVAGIRHAGVGCRSLCVKPHSREREPESTGASALDVDSLSIADIVAACGSGPELVL